MPDCTQIEGMDGCSWGGQKFFTGQGKRAPLGVLPGIVSENDDEKPMSSIENVVVAAPPQNPTTTTQ